MTSTDMCPNLKFLSAALPIRVSGTYSLEGESSTFFKEKEAEGASIAVTF